MALESVTHIADLVITNPTSTDPKSQGDDHLRNIKIALANDFAGFTGAVCVTGTDGGAVNAYTLTPANALPAYGTKMAAVFAPTITSTGAVTLNISGLGAKALNSISGAALVSGDLLAGSLYIALYTGTEFRLIAPTKNYMDQLAMSAALPAQALGLLISTGSVASFSKALTGFALDEVKSTAVASAATIDVQSGTAGITGNLIHITGTTTITAITLASGAERTLVFDGILTLTHNATTLILPGGQNITTAAGDRCIVRGDGAGNVRVISYVRAAASPGFQALGAAVASATTVNLTTSTGDFTHITGTTTITGITINSGDERTVVFDGALTLTHNATTLILPGAANITTAAGDTAIFRGDGAGNTRCISYVPASGKTIIASGVYAFGDGTDGNVTVSGSVTLSRDMFYNNLTLSGSAAINTAGYRIFVAGTLDISAAPSGSIFNNGGDGGAGGNGGYGSPGTAGTAGAAAPAGSMGGSAAGIAGRVGVTNSNGTNGAAGTPQGNGGAISAVSGAGGGDGAGRTGGTTGGTTTTNTYVPQQWPSVPIGLTISSGTTYTKINGGASGNTGGTGAAGASSGSGGSGGSGGGGGIISIAANVIARGTNSNSSIIKAVGGNAGPGGQSTDNGGGSNSGGAGGSGGGGGGWIVLMYSSLTGSTIANAIDVSGGVGANGITAISTLGIGGNGGDAGDSGIVHVYNLSTGTLTITTSVAGTAGTAHSGATGGTGSTNVKKINL